jgi:Glycosyltransferase family 87
MSAPLRGGKRRSRHAPLLAGAAVAVIAGIALIAVHSAPRSAVPRAVAIRTALRGEAARRALSGLHWTSVRTEPLDSRTERVSFFTGPRIAADVLVQSTAGPTGAGAQVVQAVNARSLRIPYGNWLAYQPALLFGLGFLFVLMAGVSPWRRVRNLDVAAAMSLLGSMLLFQYRYVDASMVVAAAGLGYLALRCARCGLGTRSESSPSTPLLTAVTRGWDPAIRVRWMRVSLVVLALVILMVGPGSPSAVDVLYAAMEGATRLIHGLLPYGHMPSGIVHGDTYPILSYVLYTPLTALAPVNSMWDSIELGLAVAALAALAGAWTVFRANAGPRRAGGQARSIGQEEAGLRAALAWLTFPPLLAVISTGTTDVVLAAMLGGAVLLWRRPTACAAMLAVAGWFKLAPFALVPVCVAPLRGRRLLAALAAVGAVSVPLLALLVILGGPGGPMAMVHAVAYQFSRGSGQSIWGALGIPGLQPLGQACVLGLMAAIVVKLRRDPEVALDRARMAALAAAILICLQLAADYWAFLYLVWIVPVLCMSLLADPGAGVADTEPVAHAPARLQAAAASVA